MPMDRKWIILICIVVLLIIGIGGFIFFSKQKQKKRDYELQVVSEYTYYVLSANDKYGIIKKDGNVIVEPNYDEVQIPNQDKGIFIVKENDEYKVFNEANQPVFANIQNVSAVVRKRCFWPNSI